MAEQGLFDDHHLEIGRRRESTNTHVPNRTTSTFAPNKTDTGGAFVLEDQNVILFSISHTGFPPISLDGLGAIRLYGAFPDDAEAISFAPVILAEDPGVSMVKQTMREWFVVPSTPERFGCAAEMDAKRDEILGLHDKLLEDDRADFEGRYDKRGEERDGAEQDDARRIEDLEDVEDDAETDEAVQKVPVPEGGKTCKKRLSAQTQLAGQRYAVVSTLYPPEDPHGEFLVKIYGCFDNPQEADAWVRNQASSIVQRENLDVVKLHEWVKPGVMSSTNAPKEEFRDGELNNIMQFHKDEPSRVKNYKQWLKDNPETSLTNDTADVQMTEAREDGGS